MPSSHRVADSKLGVFSHAAVLLLSGHVLRMGGYRDAVAGDPERYVDEYDLIADRWISPPDMSLPRALFTATMLMSGPHAGAVLVAGGTRGSYSLFYATDAAELYIPGPHEADGTWMPLPPMASRRALHTATVLHSGELLVVGGLMTNVGSPEPPPPLTSAEIFDPSTLSWRSTTGSMSEPRYDHSATLLPDGRVLVAGGNDGWTALNTAEIYDPLTDSFNHTASPMIKPRLGASAVLLDSESVLVAGGLVDYGLTPTDTTEYYSITSDTWVSGLPLALPDTNHFFSYGSDGPSPLIKMPDGSLLFFHQGGGGEIEYFREDVGAWTVVGNLVMPRMAFTATLLPTGQVLIASGIDGSTGTNTNEIYS